MDLAVAQNLKHSDWSGWAGKVKAETGCFIHGEFLPAEADGMFETGNPATGEIIMEVARGRAADVDRAVASARSAFKSGVWSRMEPRDRMEILYRYADLIDNHAGEFAILDTVDMGKPIADMLAADVPFSSLTFRYFGETIDKIEGAVTNTAADALHYILRQLIGVVASIVPWIYPWLMTSWKVAPAQSAW